MFYKSFIKSVLCFSFICWYFNLSVKNKNNLQKIVRVSSKIIGDTRRDITKFCEKQVLENACSILIDGSHVIYSMFNTLLSGRRFGMQNKLQKVIFYSCCHQPFLRCKMYVFYVYILYIYIYIYIYIHTYIYISYTISLHMLYPSERQCNCPNGDT